MIYTISEFIIQIAGFFKTVYSALVVLNTQRDVGHEAVPGNKSRTTPPSDGSVS
jgi:hypothetical protein